MKAEWAISMVVLWVWKTVFWTDDAMVPMTVEMREKRESLLWAEKMAYEY